ncbi:FkbM family methyltransferase, partial [Candidatus Woesearchaeota archaeon]|nr:FkbM family methyltransferase [Candidatus Woesearchaeota archaeon]
MTWFVLLRKIVKFIRKTGVDRLPFVKSAYRLFYNAILVRFKPKYLDVEGFRIYLNPADQSISDRLIMNKKYEQFETEIMKNHVKKGSIVLDIGANIGIHTLLLAKIVGTEGKVIAFEPDPDNYFYLKRNVRANNLSNIHCVRKAISDTNGILYLYVNADNKGDHRTYDSADNRKKIKIEAVKLDDHLKDFGGKINFVKMDIQGAEYKAVKGMIHILSNANMITEFDPYLLEKAGVKPAEYLE